MEEKFEFNFNSHWFHIPGYLQLDVPNEVRNEIENSINQLDNKDFDKIDYRKSLAGHLYQEFELPITPKIRYLTESLAMEYDKIFLDSEPIACSRYCDLDRKKGIKYVLHNFWINYAKKYDFNPLHTHSGDYSFVIWVKIPFDIEEEMSKYDPNGNETTAFSFRYVNSLGRIGSKHFFIDKSWEWKMIFFPACLSHSVNPFYTTDEKRISISGNVYSKINDD